ncbi:MetQ/NlpA family ABC transporter substrate-binding protein [Oceanobacillus polygoni]|uniref:D-methionine transport system substrate-binding protein n=1 Tax=Oceanobacillus polygoni TaxID=1235259 RepID=A0A9X0YVC4_9BACI|nr:MetQ/NlpA family ABC transporter substrate-binding protein [Oceanobacillus polygoni]MBP2079553.1 D-methionine transport system substrate-binding protein [Oceanobacillus polygoni]
MNKILLNLLVLSIFIILAGCASSGASGNETIKIGVTGGPPEEITNIVQEEAKKEGIELEIVKFNDYITPNRALNGGELDLNMFQTKQFLAQYVEDRNDPLVALGTTYNSTTGIYSEKYESVDQIPDGATLGVINDPVNTGRSLLLYEEAGLITVKSKDGLLTLNDIDENPRNFKFTEIEGPLMLRTLGSIDVGTVASTHAFDQGMEPAKDAIYLETGMEFPMVVAAKEEDKDNADYKRIVELYHSDAVKEFIEERYKDVIIVTDDPFQID